MRGNFISFIRKEFLHIFRDKWTLLIIIGMPVVQMLLFGFAISTEIRNVNIAVFDCCSDAMTQRIIDRIDRSMHFNVVESIEDRSGIDRVFREGIADAVIVFGSGFSAKAEFGNYAWMQNGAATGKGTRNGTGIGDGAEIQIMIDGSDPNRASMINAYLNGILTSCNKDILSCSACISWNATSSKIPGMAINAGTPDVSASYETTTAGRIEPVVRMLYNPQGKSAYNFVPGVMGLILMLICAMMTAVAIVREKESGSMEVLLSSPVSPLGIIIAKAIPYLTLSFIDLCIILVCATTVLDVPIAGSLGALLGVSLLFLACTLGIGLLISTVAQTQMAAMIISSVGLLMPTMLLSGLMFPIESMPAILQWISAVVPARWYIQAVKIIMIQGAPVRCALTEIGVLLLMTAVVTAASVKNFKTRII